MKFKQIIFLGAIFLLLLVVLLTKKVFIKPEVETTEYAKLQVSLDSASIYAVEFKKGNSGDTVRLEREEEEWRIPTKWNIRADKQRIENLMKDIGMLQGELRSSSKKLFSDYGISPDKAFSITTFDKEGNPQDTFFVGTKKLGTGSSFLRKGDSEDVYLVDKDIFSLLGVYGNPEDAALKTDKWIDLSIEKLDSETIESINIVRRDGEREIVTCDLKREFDKEKNLKRWFSLGKEPIFDIDAAKIKNFLQDIN